MPSSLSKPPSSTYDPSQKTIPTKLSMENCDSYQSSDNTDPHTYYNNQRKVSSTLDPLMRGRPSCQESDEHWTSTIESSIVKAILQPIDCLGSQFDTMEGINSPLPESIKQCNSRNGRKYRVTNKSNRYNTWTRLHNIQNTCILSFIHHMYHWKLIFRSCLCHSLIFWSNSTIHFFYPIELY